MPAFVEYGLFMLFYLLICHYTGTTPDKQMQIIACLLIIADSIRRKK